MRLDRSRIIQIGRLGRFRFGAGIYGYVGSAWGPGGLAARLGRHLQTEKKCRWHIDYLRRHAPVIEIWVGRCRPPGDHLWAGALGSIESAAIPADQFGSSDCRCPAHLFSLPAAVCIREFNRVLVQRRSGKQKAHIWAGRAA